MTIRFYHTRDPFGALSNHSDHGFVLDGLCWPTVEHYFQAQKFAGTEYAEIIRQTPSPMAAKRLGQRRDLPLRPDWEQVKESAMLRATLAKFETHADARAVLLATGDEELVEDAPMDYYWGCGADGSGLNRYGHVLMQARGLLRGS